MNDLGYPGHAFIENKQYIFSHFCLLSAGRGSYSFCYEFLQLNLHILYSVSYIYVLTKDEERY
jgi:hypothetical protein